MAQLLEFKAKITDGRIQLQKDLEYQVNKIEKESEDYILKSINKMLGESVFSVKREIAIDTFSSAYRKIVQAIKEKVEDMFYKQIQDVNNKIVDMLRNYEAMTYEDLENKIFVAKNNIDNITKDNVDKIDGLINKEINDSIRQYLNDAGVKLDEKEIFQLEEVFKDDLKNNINAVKNEFVRQSRNSITNYYDDTKARIRNNKLNELGKEELEQKNVSGNDAVTADVLESEKENKKGVPVSDLGNDFLDFDVIVKYMMVFDPEMKLRIEDDALVATDSSGIPYSIEKKEDVISFTGKGEDSKRLGLKIDEQNKTLTVKKYQEENMIIFDPNENNIILTCSIDGKTSSYELRFIQGNVLASELNGDNKKPVENVDELIKKLKSNNINIDSVLEISKDLSMGNTQRS